MRSTKIQAEQTKLICKKLKSWPRKLENIHASITKHRSIIGKRKVANAWKRVDEQLTFEEYNILNKVLFIVLCLCIRKNKNNNLSAVHFISIICGFFFRFFKIICKVTYRNIVWKGTVEKAITIWFRCKLCQVSQINEKNVRFFSIVGSIYDIKNRQK